MQHFADGRLALSGGPVAVLTISAPAVRNAMNGAMWAALPDIAARIAADEGVRALVVTGSGGCFSAGADITEFEAIYSSAESALAANAAIRAGLAALRALPRPVIAAIDGPCVGGGVAMALACDRVIAAPDAVFAIPPARLGIAYTPEDTAMLLERITAPRAKDLLMSARRLGAEEALAWGLVDALDAAPLAAAQAQAEALGRLSQASIRHSKRTVNALASAATDTGLSQALAELFSGPDFIEGRSAFLERRPPKF